MLTINSRNDRLAAARIEFSSRGMLDGTCLGEALKKLRNALEDIDDSDCDTESSSDSDSEEGQDLDADEDEDDTTGPVDGPPPLSDVTLAQKRGENASPSYILTTSDVFTQHADIL